MPMGSPDDTSTPAKPSNSKPLPSAMTLPLAPEVMTTAAYSAEWAASVQAFYSGGAGAPPAFFPPVWGGQHLMSPYATPIAYSPIFAPGAVYGHPSLTPGISFPNAELGSIKAKGALLKFGEGGKAASGSGEDESSQSNGGSATEGSSGSGNDSADLQESSKKRPHGDIFQEGEASHSPIANTQRKRASKLPVSAPGRTALSSPTTNLNIGMGIWNQPDGSAPLKVGPNSLIAEAAASRVNDKIVDHHWVQKDDRELKRERRKQSNRESARRSRLRKQQECDDLARKVAELNGENNTLRMELEQLHKVCKELGEENQQIAEELRSLRGDSSYSLKRGDNPEPISR